MNVEWIPILEDEMVVVSQIVIEVIGRCVHSPSGKRRYHAEEEGAAFVWLSREKAH